MGLKLDASKRFDDSSSFNLTLLFSFVVNASEGSLIYLMDKIVISDNNAAQF